ncbi:hypothetical protein Pst134EB_014082 [Puccinia striiformis f. sp. tritici]|uniref:Uncharacterized protein n=1 Tax=Puccinia striiformis f. sp. tritici PST-78 TaxID=1165861 RepID=A0A0L0UXZ8_9BASI|nr:hypothetical protein Pst134EB_014082 [Puccinia striiformis f. sp. tritici]KNE91619.1 hypothetical protein PSTG_14971 [Puccinia striiformis f. sp. tritici PST-78]
MTAAPYNLVMRLYCGMIYMEARINCNLQQFLVNDSQVRMVLLKTLTDPLLQIVDLQVIIQLFKAIFPESIIVVNYTMMSPYLSLMKTLKAVAHVVYNSSTKYLSGHHGLMAGLVTCSGAVLGFETSDKKLSKEIVSLARLCHTTNLKTTSKTLIEHSNSVYRSCFHHHAFERKHFTHLLS